jgi:hypothetical protein
MRETETALQQFAEFLLRARLARPNAAPHLVRWVRRFLARPAADMPLADQVRQFCESLEHDSRFADWQVLQANQALRIYFLNFLKRTDWTTAVATAPATDGRTDPLAALELVRTRLRTRHYSYRTEQTYVDWARRFFDYTATRQTQPHPTITVADVRDFLTHLAVERHVSASSQNQAGCALLFLCREVLNLDAGPSDSLRYRRGESIASSSAAMRRSASASVL